MVQRPKVTARVNAQPAGVELITCAIVRGEVMFGIELLALGRKRSDLESQAAKYFALVSPQPVPVLAGDLFATTKLACVRNGVVLNDNDLWIAATTLALGATLVTRDKDFTR